MDFPAVCISSTYFSSKFRGFVFLLKRRSLFQGAGSHLLLKPRRIEQIVKCAVAASRTPVTIKVRTGFLDKQATSHLFMPQVTLLNQTLKLSKP